MDLDTSLFLDVADALGISSPAIVEKDFWATQLLKELSQLTPVGFSFVFSGGTSLSKAYQNTYRMSEDIDIKLIPSSDTQALSRSRRRELRGDIHNLIVDVVRNSADFSLVSNPIKRNEGRYQQFILEYPKSHGTLTALRPHIQLELNEDTPIEAPIIHSFGSLFASCTQQPNEVNRLACSTVNVTAAEKLVALLRRTAAHARDGSRKDDPTLIRHVYDLHLIFQGRLATSDLKSVVNRVIELDQSRYGRQHSEFVNDPFTELRYGLSILQSQTIYRGRYQRFINPLVYHPAPAQWDEAIATIESLTHVWL